MPESEQQPQSLYRRNRPRTFAEVVGQEAVVRTLRNAVERGRVHHAYLFVGSRGTGKTSMAKILAACLNCERGLAAPGGAGHPATGAPGGAGGPAVGGFTTEPCGECESCRAIARASSLDVIEMDAASNNSVEDIRELRDSVAFAPVSGRSKVYILDEAHMLSTAAWNAFLKTLEEPPPSTVFVLATTEAQKVPATVVDRCQRFDFQRPTVEQIAAVVRRAAAAEQIEIPAEAVAAVARSATGSFRDALGTLEQLYTYSGPRIALEDVLAVLGATDSRLLEETIDAVHAGDARAALLAVAGCAERGRDAGALAADLEVRARELLVVGTVGELPAELALTPEADARLEAQAGRVGQGTVVRLLEQLGSALEAVKAGGDPRTQLELALVKAARPEVDGSLGALLARIERLEARGGEDLGGGGGALGAAPGAAAPQSPQPAETHPAGGGPGGAPGSVGEATGGQRAGDGPEDAVQAVQAPTTADASQDAAVAVPPAEDARQDAAAAAPPDVEALAALWPAVVDLVGAQNKLLSAVIAEGRPVAVGEGELTVAFATSASFLKKKAEDSAHRATVTEALRQLTGERRLRVSYELREDLPPASSDVRETPRTEDEWVARFMEEFDAEELVGAGEAISESE